MAQLKYLDKTGLEAYDAKIKDYIGAEIESAGTLLEGYIDTAESNAKSYTDTEVAGAKSYADQKAGEVLSGTVGSTTQPVYLNDGVITAIGHTIGVDVPSNAKFTDTTYTGGSGISVSGTTINHANTVTAGVIGQKTNESVAFGGVIDIPYADYDANGHIVSKGERTVTLPAAPTTITGNAGTASKLQTARTITLAGDVSGSVGFDGSKNVSITTTVADDSHSHTIANIDNLQTTLNAKAPLASPTFTGTPKIGSANIATETYVTEAIAEHVAEVAGGLQYKGTVGTGGTVTSLPTSGVKIGDFYKVATAGEYGGHTCEVNDMILASEVEPDIVWDVLQANIDGAVTGPDSSTANHLAAFSNTTGKIIKDSGLTTSSISSAITKVNGIASGAEVNQNAFSTVIAGGTSLASTSKTDTLAITDSGPITVTGSGKTVTIGISAATTSSAGSMSAADKTKLNGIATGANNYIHPTTSGNKHIPSGGSSGQILRWSSDGTAVWGNDNNTTYSVATTSANGLMSSADKAKLDGIASGANKYTLPAATSGALGGVRIGYAESGKNYPVELNSSNQMFVNVPWTDTDTNYYPTKFSWTNGTTTGPTGSLTGTGMSAVSISAIPSASASQSGVVTTGTQTFAGAKTFSSTITGNISGNAGTATKLQTARTIKLGTGVSSTATSFNGSGNITIPVIGISEAYLKWGGQNFTESFGPIDAAMIPDLGANRFMFLNPEGITIEYSTNGGSSWTDYGASDSQKRGLFAKGSNFAVGKATSSSFATANSRLRVTIDTDKAKVYTALNKFMIFCSTNGSSGSYVTIEKALQSTPTKYETVAENVPIAGWSGYNIINVSQFTTYGNLESLQYGRIRFTFGIESHDSITSPGLAIIKIAAFGGVGWTTPSTMATNGHLYSFDNDLNAAFPAKVTAEDGFRGNLDGVATSASRLATARTINGTSFNGTDNITTTNWGTARTITIGNSGKSVNGGANVAWTLSEIGAAAASHNHSASNITSGTLPVARGGTGVTASPSMLVNLASTSAASVFAASPRPGVTGTLPIANGGTGATSASAARTALGAAASSHTHARSLYKPTKTYQKVTFTNSTSSATISPYSANMDIEVYYNGFLLMEGEDYTRSNATITFTSALGGTGVEQTLVIVKRDYS